MIAALRFVQKMFPISPTAVAGYDSLKVNEIFEVQDVQFSVRLPEVLDPAPLLALCEGHIYEVDFIATFYSESVIDISALQAGL